MAFPYIFAEGFESGTNGLFDNDSGSLLDFPHYTTLARWGMAPYRGAYCMRVLLNGGTTTQYTEETGSFDFAAADRRFVRWYFYLGSDFTMADTDKFAMFNLESVAGATVIVAAGIDRSGSSIRLWYANTNSSTAQTIVIGTLDPPGNPNSCLRRWHHVELNMLIDSGAGNDGTIQGYYNDGAFGTTITALDQALSVDARFGVIGPDAGTSGTLLIDDVILDDLQIYSDRVRYPVNRWIVQADDHPMIGPGRVSVGVTGTGTDAVLSLYDTDGVPNRLEPIAVLRNVSANEFIPGHDVFDFSHGLYATLSGTNPQGFVSLEMGGLHSQGALITRGLKQGRPMP